MSRLLKKITASALHSPDRIGVKKRRYNGQGVLRGAG
jgi:hypothetical protein